MTRFLFFAPDFADFATLRLSARAPLAPLPLPEPGSTSHAVTPIVLPTATGTGRLASLLAEGNVQLLHGEWDMAADAAERVLLLAGPEEPAHMAALCLGAEVDRLRGQMARAEARFAKARNLAASAGAEEQQATAAVGLAQIAAGRGDPDQALRLLRAEALPVYERLGEVRSRAVTMGRIADILQARGQLDEALRIRREEELPVFERLGDVRSLLVGRTNLALTLARRGRPEDGGEIAGLLRRAFSDARRLGIPEAATIAMLYQRIFGREIEEGGDREPDEP
jgi:ATP/maltotriose-dependent transcriptional regulator MalT